MKRWEVLATLTLEVEADDPLAAEILVEERLDTMFQMEEDEGGNGMRLLRRQPVLTYWEVRE